jgi:predicted outer membrane repeat protein
MKGGLIAGNTVAKGAEVCGGGGGVYVGSESVLDMRDGEISGNIVGKAAEGEDKPAVMGNGGGVYVDSGGIFNMSGGTVASNTATDSGGGVYVDKGNFYKTGGSVYGSGDSGNNTAGTGYEQPATQKGHAFYGEPGQPADKTLPDSFSF